MSSTATTHAERLRAARDRTFVGRATETALFDAMLADTAPFQLLWLTGPGGMGKSTLLQRLADRAHDAGVGVAVLNGSAVAPSPEAVRAAVERRIGEAGPGRVALLVDGVDDLVSLDDWLRTELLPGLPAEVVVVLASRHPPGSRWRTDLGWGSHLRVLALADLQPQEVGEYLERRGLPAALTPDVVNQTRGHPLALALVTDALERTRDRAPGGTPDARTTPTDPGGRPLPPLTDRPDVIQMLLERFLDEVPDPTRRRALAVFGLARATTVPLLRATAGDDAEECFQWLAGLSFAGLTDEGLVPHELARHVLDGDLRWRDPRTWQELQELIRADARQRLLASTGAAAQQAATDLLWFHRSSPLLAPHWAAEDGRSLWVDQATARDLSGILDLVARHEGPDSVQIHRGWWERQPDAFHVLRAAGEPVRGFLMHLRLPDPAARSVGDAAANLVAAADPVASAAWRLVTSHGRLRPGEHVRVIRSWIGIDGYHLPTPTNRAFTAAVTRQILTEPGLAATVAYAVGAELWTPLYGYADYARAEAGDAVVDGRRLVAFLHDWRISPPLEWLELMDARLAVPASGGPASGGPASGGPAGAREAVEQARRHLADGPQTVLSEAEFATAVRDAFRNALDPSALGRSPLMGTRVVRSAAQPGAAPTAADLQRLLTAEVNALRARPRRDTAARAVELTYLTTVRTQEAAAARLSLPFSTYRRHLTSGLTDVTRTLWQRELGT